MSRSHKGNTGRCCDIKAAVVGDPKVEIVAVAGHPCLGGCRCRKTIASGSSSGRSGGSGGSSGSSGGGGI